MVSKNEQKITLIKIYKATLGADNKWGNIVELPFNSDHYSTAHPSLSPDEKTLYFASLKGQLIHCQTTRFVPYILHLQVTEFWLQTLAEPKA